MIVVKKKKCLIAYAKLNESGSFMTNHEISCLEQGERNERFWTFGPSSSARHAKEGRPPATNYTPPSAPSPQVPWNSEGTHGENQWKEPNYHQMV